MKSCLTPYYGKNPSFGKVKGAFQFLPFPCGNCVVCLHKRANQWAFRMKQESKVSLTSHFVTLTYNDDFLKISPNGFMTLSKTDPTNFIKRLRYISSGSKKSDISYYLGAEYGNGSSHGGFTNERPHYHAIIFNANEQAIYDAWALDGKEIGFVDCQPAGEGSMTYVAKYMTKGKLVGKVDWDDRVPEFQRFSNGLGKSYYDSKAIKAYHNQDPIGRNIATLEGGYKMPLPKSWKKRIFSDTSLIKLENHYNSNEFFLEGIRKDKFDYLKTHDSLEYYEKDRKESLEYYLESCNRKISQRNKGAYY